jgi:aconitate hydratase/homoaconitate hydratase
MCLGVASRRAGKGEKWLSSQNRNYENRMGEGSLAYLAAAATVAAAAPEMKVADPRPLLARVDQERYRRILGERRPRRAPEVRSVEPEAHLAPAGATAVSAREGRAADKQRAAVVRSRIQRFGDNVDTDAIIPGQFCHLTSLPELGAKCFHFVRPQFAQNALQGARVVVAGEGWGSGSSREQAVLALKGAGVQAIVARSYAFIHKRNLVNEALPFLVVQDAEFYEVAKEGEEIEVDLASGRVTVAGKTFRAETPSKIIQALADEGGIVPAIQRHGTTVFDKLTS